MSWIDLYLTDHAGSEMPSGVLIIKSHKHKTELDRHGELYGLAHRIRKHDFELWPFG